MRTRIVLNNNSIHVWEKSYAVVEGNILSIIDWNTKETKKGYYLSEVKDYQVQDELVEPRTAAGSLD